MKAAHATLARFALAMLAAGAASTFAMPAEASVQARAGLDQGLNLGLGMTGASLNLTAGPITVGGAVTSASVYYGSVGTSLTPAAHLVYTVRDTGTIAFGLLGAYTGVQTYASTPVGVAPEPVVIPVGEAGLALSYRYDFPNFFGRSLPITFSPTVTFMTDDKGMVKFGPHTSLEVAARFTPEAELTVGGGTIVGVRFRL
ncbi:hypothetical protein J7643_16600 [bacterium]|nr:hypothetical protein [bacterium]